MKIADQFSKSRVLALGIFTLVVAAFKRTLDRERKLARIDHLTGVVNARRFYEIAGRKLRRSRRARDCFTVAYMDVDDFKSVNDSLGHGAGDSLLSLVADTVKNNLRRFDVVARLGGDEFAVFLPDTNYEEANAIMHRLRLLLLNAMQSRGFPVTFSIGVITYVMPATTVHGMMSSVDSLMYSVKKRGKNDICHELYEPMEKAG